MSEVNEGMEMPSSGSKSNSKSEPTPLKVEVKPVASGVVDTTTDEKEGDSADLKNEPAVS